MKIKQDILNYQCMTDHYAIFVNLTVVIYLDSLQLRHKRLV